MISRKMWGWVGVYWYVVRLRGQKWVGGGRPRAPVAGRSGIEQGQGIIHPRTRKHFILRGELMI